MNVISRKKLEAFWREHPDSKAPLKSRYNNCRKAHWKTLDEVQEIYPHVELVGDCTVFKGVIKSATQRLRFPAGGAGVSLKPGVERGGAERNPRYGINEVVLARASGRQFSSS